MYLNLTAAVVDMGISAAKRVTLAVNSDQSIVAIIPDDDGPLKVVPRRTSVAVSGSRLRGILATGTRYPVTRDDETGWFLIHVTDAEATA